MTVLELKAHVVALLDLSDFHKLYRVSPDLWRKLNRLGGRGLPARDEDIPPDIDAAAHVTWTEAQEILCEAASLRK